MQIKGKFSQSSEPTEEELNEVKVAKEMRDGKRSLTLGEIKYYYKVLAASPTGKKLLSLREQIEAVDRAAFELASKFQAAAYLPSTMGVFGGISALEFRSNPGKVWKFLCSEDGHNYYKPNTEYKKGKTRREQMNDLPIIDPRAMNRILGIDSGKETFGMLLHEGYYFIVSSHPAVCLDTEIISMAEFIEHKDAFLLDLQQAHAAGVKVKTQNTASKKHHHNK